MWKETVIDNRICHVLNKGNSGPVFIWPFYYDGPEELEHMEDLLSSEAFESGYSLIACEVRDWDRELSPWPGQAMDGSIMEGRGKELLDWMKTSLFPWIDSQSFSADKYCIIGYSLAGLFAMWSLYESELFDGCISGSGSFWFEEWKEYAEKHSPKKHCSVYLSLGGKEEKTKNVFMASVGDRTRELEKLLKADPMVDTVRLEMNPGGHFADSSKRLLKGLRWIIDSYK